MAKKAQGLSLNVIIVAAIALIVLIVLWAIFTGKMGSFTEGVGDTDQKCKDLCSASGYPAAGNGAVNVGDCNDGDVVSKMKIDGVEKDCCCTPKKNPTT